MGEVMNGEGKKMGESIQWSIGAGISAFKTGNSPKSKSSINIYVGSFIYFFFSFLYSVIDSAVA